MLDMLLNKKIYLSWLRHRIAGQWLTKKDKERRVVMARLFKYILSAIFVFGSVPALQAMDMKMDNMEEVKKKKKKKKKKGSKGKKKKKGFFSKAFGSK